MFLGLVYQKDGHLPISMDGRMPSPPAAPTASPRCVTSAPQYQMRGRPRLCCATASTVSENGSSSIPQPPPRVVLYRLNRGNPAPEILRWSKHARFEQTLAAWRWSEEKEHG